MGSLANVGLPVGRVPPVAPQLPLEAGGSMESHSTGVPKRSLAGLNAANFFQAEMVGFILPILNAFLKQANWR